MEIVYKGYIYEARNILDEYELIKKYGRLDDSYYFSYRGMHKVGVNPRSIHETPNGVYTYNFHDVDNRLHWSNKDIAYRGDLTRGYVYVLKLKDGFKGIDSETYGVSDLNSDISKIREMYSNSESLGEVEEILAKETKNIGVSLSIKIIWRITRLLSFLPNHRSNPNKWSKILLSLGYSYVRDRGTKTIHRNEPEQTLFLDPKSYEVVEYGTFGNHNDISGRRNHISLTRKKFSTEADPNDLNKFSTLLRDYFRITNDNVLIEINSSEYADEFYRDYSEYVFHTYEDFLKEAKNPVQFTEYLHRTIKDEVLVFKTYPTGDVLKDASLMRKIDTFLYYKELWKKYQAIYKNIIYNKILGYSDLIKTNIEYFKILLDKNYFNLMSPDLSLVSFINKYFGSEILVDLIVDKKIDPAKLKLPNEIIAWVNTKEDELEYSKQNPDNDEYEAELGSNIEENL